MSKLTFNTYEASVLLGVSETVVTDLAKAGHVLVANAPINPLAKKRQKNVYNLRDLETYAGRTFNDTEIAEAVRIGAESKRIRKELYTTRHERVPNRQPAIGTLGRSGAPSDDEPLPVEEIAAAQDLSGLELDRLYGAGLQRARLVWPKATAGYHAALSAAFVGYVAGMRENLAPDDEILIQRLAAQYT